MGVVETGAHKQRTLQQDLGPTGADAYARHGGKRPLGGQTTFPCQS